MSDVALAVGGRLEGGDVEVSSVAIDSRAVRPGSLFVALRGESADGHAFVADAVARGAAGVLVERDPNPGVPAVVVPDAGHGLMDLAADERAHIRAAVVGITGSTGKTCTKDMAAAVLGSRFAVQASPASFNNEVGLPLTVLSADERTEALICEMGSRGLGHITALCRVARPSIGVVTNVGVAHLGMFGSKQNIARAKAELAQALPPDGTAVLNADDPVVRRFADHTPARVLLFGRSPESEVRAEDVDLDADGRASFVLIADGDREHVELAVAGEHMVSNALAAAACGLALGVSAAESAAALKAARVSEWRMEVTITPGGVTVVNDAYNANPASMAAALRTARWMARGRRCIAVLGHMAELGDAAAPEHERVGELVARLGIDHLVTVGELAGPIAGAAVREGVEPGNVEQVATREEALGRLRELVRPGDVVLVKASRVAGLERLAEAVA